MMRRTLAAALAAALLTAPSARADESAVGFVLKVLGLKSSESSKASQPVPQAAEAAAARTPAAGLAGLKTTHQQTDLIQLHDDQGRSTRLHTFCLNPQGQILAGCGQAGQGEVRVFDPDGEYLKTWSLPVLPEAINTGPQGLIYVAGEGRLLKLSAEGKVLLDKPAPHMAGLDKEKIRAQVTAQFKSRAKSYQRSLEVYQKEIDRLTKLKEDKGQLSAVEKQRLQVYQRAKTTMKRYIEQNVGKSNEPTEAQIEQQIKSMLSRKAKPASISSTGDEVFLACSAVAGYGYQVYRMDSDFEDAESIVSDLRGCCGQMDVQACDQGLYVAENSRHRVVRFDRQGKQLASWGQKDRTGENGFSSCCNPMNVCFGPGGSVYTAESTTGHIKRWTPDGKFVSHVGVVKLVPGCKKVSIAVSPDGKRVYMMDITRHHIVLMKQQQPSTQPPLESTAAASGD